MGVDSTTRSLGRKNEEDGISIQDLVDQMVEVLESLVGSKTDQAVDIMQPMETETNGCCHNQCQLSTKLGVNSSRNLTGIGNARF